MTASAGTVRWCGIRALADSGENRAASPGTCAMTTGFCRRTTCDDAKEVVSW